MGNQTQIPVIQMDEKNTVQIQQNVNKVLRYLQLQITGVTEMLNAMTIIGEIKISSLTEEQFQEIAGDNWQECDGGSCVGSKYSLLTGNNVLPTITSPLGDPGSIAMIRID